MVFDRGPPRFGIVFRQRANEFALSDAVQCAAGSFQINRTVTTGCKSADKSIIRKNESKVFANKLLEVVTIIPNLETSFIKALVANILHFSSLT